MDYSQINILANLFNKSAKSKNDYSAGILFFCKEDKTVLLVKRSKIMKSPETWDIPGGRNDGPDKSILTTGIREATEELGSLPEKKIFHTKYKFNTKSKKKEPYFYHVFIYSISKKVKDEWTKEIDLDKENKKFKWFDINDLPTNTHFDLTWIPEQILISKSSNERFPLLKRAVHDEGRTELKFLIPISLIPEIREFITYFAVPDEHGQQYNISSIYFDSKNLTLFRRQKDKNKYKLRARIYNHNTSIVFLEVKENLDNRIYKERLSVDMPKFKQLMNSQYDFGIYFLNKIMELEAVPVVLVNYDREAYVLPGTDTRITFDTNLSYCKKSRLDFDDENQEPLARPNIAILEIKFNDKMPNPLRQMIDKFKLSSSPFSKYFLSILRMVQ